MATATFNPTLDAFISQTGSSASDDSLYTGNVRVFGVDSVRRLLMRFDLSSLPAAAVITAGMLTLSNNGATTFTGSPEFWMYGVTRDDWTADVTWYTYDGTNPWTSNGADYEVPPPLGPSVIPSDLGDIASTSDNLILHDMSVFLQNAQDAGGQLDLIIVGPETPGTAAYFAGYSGDYAVSASRPLLSVTYSVADAAIGWTGKRTKTDWKA